MAGLLALPQPGDLVGGKYLLESAVDRCEFGAVYAARHRQTGRRFALRWLIDAAPHGDSANDAEQQVIGCFQHPLVLSPLDYGRARHATYLVMDWLDGETLSARLKRHTKLSLSDTVRLLTPCMRGLYEAHLTSMVHGELRPGNIFVCSANHQVETVRVFDYSLCRPNLPSGFVTPDGQYTRHAFYLAPEQISGGTPDRRTDVYAFGVILYRALTGRIPFSSENGDEFARWVYSEDPALPPMTSALTPAVYRVLMHAMARNPAERFDNCNDLANALETLLRTQRLDGLHTATDVVGRRAKPLSRVATMRLPQVPAAPPAPPTVQQMRPISIRSDAPARNPDAMKTVRMPRVVLETQIARSELDALPELLEAPTQPQQPTQRSPQSQHAYAAEESVTEDEWAPEPHVEQHHWSYARRPRTAAPAPEGPSAAHVQAPDTARQRAGATARADGRMPYDRSDVGRSRAPESARPSSQTSRTSPSAPPSRRAAAPPEAERGREFSSLQPFEARPCSPPIDRRLLWAAACFGIVGVIPVLAYYTPAVERPDHGEEALLRRRSAAASALPQPAAAPSAAAEAVDLEVVQPIDVPTAAAQPSGVSKDDPDTPVDESDPLIAAALTALRRGSATRPDADTEPTRPQTEPRSAQANQKAPIAPTRSARRPNTSAAHRANAPIVTATTVSRERAEPISVSAAGSATTNKLTAVNPRESARPAAPVQTFDVKPPAVEQIPGVRLPTEAARPVPPTAAQKSALQPVQAAPNARPHEMDLF